MTERSAAETIVHKLMDVFWNQHQLAAAPEIFKDDALYHTMNGDIHGRATFCETYAGPFQAAFPDLHFKLTDVLVDGDKAAIHFTGKGTHKGEFHGKPATGGTLDYAASAFFHLEDGLIAEVWVYSDFARQLELL